MRRDAPEVLQLVNEALQTSEGCGLDDSAARRQLLDAAWSFLRPALQKARQLASFRTVMAPTFLSAFLQHMHSAVPQCYHGISLHSKELKRICEDLVPFLSAWRFQP